MFKGQRNTVLLGRKDIISKSARTCLVLPMPDIQEPILLQVDPVKMKKESEDKLPKNEPSTTNIAPKAVRTRREVDSQ